MFSNIKSSLHLRLQIETISRREENLADLIRYAKFNLTTNTSECLLDLLRVMLLICFENFTNLFPSLMKIFPENSIYERDETFPMLSGLKVEYSIISFRVAPN